MRTLLLLLLSLSLTGCSAFAPSRSKLPDLYAHPQFRAAAQAAPGFTQAVLDAVADLEYEADKLRAERNK